jgi:hypothetical protein
MFAIRLLAEAPLHHQSFKFPLLSILTIAALGACGGSDSVSGGNGQPQQCTDPTLCNGGGAGNTNGGGFGNFQFGGSGNMGTGNTGNVTGTGNTTSFGGTTGAGGGSLLGAGGNTQPPGPNCGNGQIDPGEDCDTGNLNGATCSSATMGAGPSGVLKCAPNCTFDLGGCHSSGNPGGTGGNTGTGGRFGGTGGGP